jgi:hypothetical protein
MTSQKTGPMAGQPGAQPRAATVVPPQQAAQAREVVAEEAPTVQGAPRGRKVLVACLGAAVGLLLVSGARRRRHRNRSAEQG